MRILPNRQAGVGWVRSVGLAYPRWQGFASAPIYQPAYIVKCADHCTSLLHQPENLHSSLTAVGFLIQVHANEALNAWINPLIDQWIKWVVYSLIQRDVDLSNSYKINQLSTKPYPTKPGVESQYYSKSLWMDMQKLNEEILCQVINFRTLFDGAVGQNPHHILLTIYMHFVVAFLAEAIGISRTNAIWFSIVSKNKTGAAASKNEWWQYCGVGWGRANPGQNWRLSRSALGTRQPKHV